MGYAVINGLRNSPRIATLRVEDGVEQEDVRYSPLSTWVSDRAAAKAHVLEVWERWCSERRALRTAFRRRHSQAQRHSRMNRDVALAVKRILALLET